MFYHQLAYSSSHKAKWKNHKLSLTQRSKVGQTSKLLTLRIQFYHNSAKVHHNFVYNENNSTSAS